MLRRAFASIWRRGRRAQRDERGLTLLIFAIGFVGLLAPLAMVADTGLVFIERRHVQNVADAAALAGARELYLNGAAAAEAETVAFAGESDANLLSNTAQAVAGPNEVTSTISKQADTLFGGGLGFSDTEVPASATARIGAPVLPGPGVFCVGVYAGLLEQERTENGAALAALNYSYIWQLTYPELTAGDYHMVLRFGSQTTDASNAGYLDIGNEGGASVSVRECFERGSRQPLTPHEPSQTGIATGPAAQGLQNRLEAARARGCFTWDEIRASIIAADGAPQDGVLEQPWKCSPLLTQETAVVLIPTTEQDFTQISGGTTVDIYKNGTGQYELGYYWIDAELTFENTNAGSWKFAGGGQGQGEIQGVFLTPYLTELTTPADGSSGSVPCVVGASVGCFLQLVD